MEAIMAEIIELQPQTEASSPASQQRLAIAALIARLLTHFWAADDPPELRRAQAEDWINDLAEFPTEFVDRACCEWRQNKTRRPTIAEIRALAIEAVRNAETRRLPRPAPSEAQIQQAADNYARDRG